MDVVVVPLVHPGAEVAPLLELLLRRERSGLVVRQPADRYQLLYAGNLIQARAQEVPTVERVQGGHRVLVVDPGTSRQFGLDLVRPFRTWQPYEGMLRYHGVEYALIGETADTAMVVTMHEGQGAALSMTAFYQCSVMSTHSFPYPRVVIGDPCPLQPECGPSSTIVAYP